MNFINGQSKPNLTQITKSESKPIHKKKFKPKSYSIPKFENEKEKKK